MRRIWSFVVYAALLFVISPVAADCGAPFKATIGVRTKGIKRLFFREVVAYAKNWQYETTEDALFKKDSITLFQIYDDPAYRRYIGDIASVRVIKDGGLISGVEIRDSCGALVFPEQKK